MNSAEQEQQIIARLRQLTPESKPQWGSMRVEQMLAHMNDALKIALGMKEAKDRSNFITRHVVFPVAVYMLPSWPKSAATAPEMAQDKKGTAARDFYTELAFAEKMIEVFSERAENKLKPHPMFGVLSKKQWADLLTKHFDHHLRQFGV